MGSTPVATPRNLAPFFGCDKRASGGWIDPGYPMPDVGNMPGRLVDSVYRAKVIPDREPVFADLADSIGASWLELPPAGPRVIPSDGTGTILIGEIITEEDADQ